MAHHGVRIERPTDEVFDFLADGTYNLRWQRATVRTEPGNDAMGTGRIFAQRVRHPLGFTVAADYRTSRRAKATRLVGAGLYFGIDCEGAAQITSPKGASWSRPTSAGPASPKSQ